jgi:hypothetical protein
MCASLPPWLGGRACRGLCEGRKKRKGAKVLAPARAATTWRNREGFPVCQCHSLVPEAARKGRAGGGWEQEERGAGSGERGAGSAAYFDVYVQMAYSAM